VLVPALLEGGFGCSRACGGQLLVRVTGTVVF